MELDNSKLYCKLLFYYDKEIPSPFVKGIIEEKFRELRNMAVDLINPHYEEWNAAYSKEVTGADDLEYNAYIASKHREILEPFNEAINSKCSQKFLWLDSDDETADIVCKYNDPLVGIVTIRMEMKLVNEEEWKKFHGITHDIHG